MGKSSSVKKSFKSRRLFIIIAVLLVDSNSNDSKVTMPFHFNEQVYNLNYNLYEQMYYTPGSSDDDAAADSSSRGNFSGDDNRYRTGSLHLPDLHERYLWLYDEASAKCLNPYGGFSLCGDVNLFKSHVLGIDGRNPLKYSLMLESAMPDSYSHHADPGDSSGKKCLGRRVSNAGEDSDVLETFIHDCDPANIKSYKNFGVGWTFEWFSSSAEDSSSSGGSDWGVLRASGSEVGGDMCASRAAPAGAHQPNTTDSNAASHKFAYLQSCEQSAAIRFIPIIYTHLRTFESVVEQPSIADGQGLSPTAVGLEEDGAWTCPRTRLPFPRNLDQYSMQRRGRQVLTGGGLFSWTLFGLTFNVYTVAWYVEREPASRSPLLLKFTGKNAAALQESKAFYEAITEPDNGYGRSILMKLAMPLKKEVVIQGMLEEMHLQPDNARVLYDVAMRYNLTECAKGTEILVSWFPPGALGIRKGSVNLDDYVEIRIGGELLATVHKEGLGKDFFTQYVSDEPVTPEGKAGFASGFPLLHAGHVVESSSRHSSGGRGAAAPQQPSRSVGEDAAESSLGFCRGAQALISHIKVRVVSEYILQRHLWNILTNKNYAPSKKFLHISNSLFNAYRPESAQDVLYSTFIVLYFILLMIMSMPMPLRRSVKKTVKKTVKKIKEITRNLSNSAIASLGLGGLDDTISTITSRESSLKNGSDGNNGYVLSFDKSVDDDDDSDDVRSEDLWK